jgi:hypothetical protein
VALLLLEDAVEVFAGCWDIIDNEMHFIEDEVCAGERACVCVWPV